MHIWTLYNLAVVYVFVFRVADKSVEASCFQRRFWSRLSTEWRTMYKTTMTVYLKVTTRSGGFWRRRGLPVTVVTRQIAVVTVPRRQSLWLSRRQRVLGVTVFSARVRRASAPVWNASTVRYFATACGRRRPASCRRRRWSSLRRPTLRPTRPTTNLPATAGLAVRPLPPPVVTTRTAVSTRRTCSRVMRAAWLSCSASRHRLLCRLSPWRRTAVLPSRQSMTPTPKHPRISLRFQVRLSSW